MSSQHHAPNIQQLPNAESKDPLRLNPGVSERRRRSSSKFCCCLWSTLIVSVLAGSAVLYYVVSKELDGLQNPHLWFYHDAPHPETTDWSNIVQPMITQNDFFSVVASVWIRDDGGGAGGIYVDGEERPERLIYSETIFRDLSLKSKDKFTNVTLRVPTNHFKQATNISNYDLRASFVLVHSQRPSWLGKNLSLDSWKPSSLRSPRVRYWAETPSLEDQIYDSFGITIPLIQFYNAPRNTSNGDVVPGVSDTKSDFASLTKNNLFEILENHNFKLDFIGNQRQTTEVHPYIVTRTHLGVVEETNLYNKFRYIPAQSQLWRKTCINPKTRWPYDRPIWYQCSRSYHSNGVFESMVRTESLGSDPGITNGRTKFEYHYAPHLTALLRAPGPKDLYAVPLDLEAPADGISKDQEGAEISTENNYINVTWNLAFSSHGAVRPFFQGFLNSQHDLAGPHDKLEYEQENHDNILGLFGYRISEDAHPRRVHIRMIIATVIGILKWALANHYWCTRGSIVGISRVGTALLASRSALLVFEGTLPAILGSEPTEVRFSSVLALLLLIKPLLMLKAILRLEFGFRGRAWVPTLYIAKATHLERASERIEARTSMKTRLLCLLALYTAAYYFDVPYSYLISPRMRPWKPNPLHALHDYAPHALKAIYPLTFTCQVGGSVLQFVMNARSGTYAGQYKISTVLVLISNVLYFTSLLPIIYGSSTALHGAEIADGAGLLISMVNVWQAVKYRNVKSSGLDETED